MGIVKRYFSSLVVLLVVLMGFVGAVHAEERGAQPWDPPAEDPVSEDGGGTAGASEKYRPDSNEDGDKGSSLKSRLGRAKLQEEIEKQRVAELKGLPGGVFRAPKIYKQIQNVVKDFQKKTNMVDGDAVYNVFLASTPEVNAWVRQVQQIDELRVFHIVVTKGLIELLTHPENVGVAADKATEMSKDSLGLLAAVLGHELGHAMNGDNSKMTMTNRMYFELNADEFAVKVLAASGYDPEAMVKVLELFEYMHDDKSLRALLSTMLDEHPKPRFRIANISDLVTMLKNGKKAREALGFDASSIPDPISGQIIRDGVERTSKSSLDGVLKNLKAADYEKKSMREKLYYLEQYLAVSKIEADGMLRQSVVALTREFSKLLSQINDLDTVEILIQSLNRFETSIGGTATMSSANEKDNVKKALTDLKEAINDKQIKLLEQDLSTEMGLKNLKKFSTQLDRRVVYGFLMRMTDKTESLEQLKDIMNAVRDNDFFLKERFQRHNSNIAKVYRKYSSRVFEAIAVRALHLTKNVEQTLDFIEENFSIQQSGGVSSVEGIHYILGGLVHYVMTHDGIEFGNFHARMDKPKTAKDRLYSEWIYENRNYTTSIAFERRGFAPDANPMSSTFRYGIGRRYFINGVPSEEFVLFIARFLNKKALESIFNELIQTHYTVDQALEMLVNRSAGTAEMWRGVRAEMAKALTRKGTYRDLETTLNIIQAYVAETHPELVEKAQPDLDSAYEDAKVILKQKTIGALNAFANARPFKAGGDADRETYVNVPLPSAKTISVLPAAEKLEIFETLLKSEVNNVVRRNAVGYDEVRKVAAEALAELVKEGKIPEEAKNEYMTALSEHAKICLDFKEGRITELPKRFFELRRQLRAMGYVLNASTVNWSTKIPSKEGRALNAILDASDSRLSSHEAAQSLINNFMVGDKAAVLKYLADPAANEARVTKQFNLISNLAKIVSYYEGFGKIGEAEELSSLSAAAMLAKDIYAPADYKVEIQEKIYDNPTVNAEQILSDREKIALLPIGDGFKKILVLENERVHSNKLTIDLYNTVYSDLWAFQLQKAVNATDPVEALIYTAAYMADTTSTTGVSEERTRMFHTLLTRSLSLVESKEQMELYTSILALYLKGHGVGLTNLGEMLNADMTKLMDITAAKYREHFFDSLARKIDQYDVWQGEAGNGRARVYQFMANVVKRIHAKVGQYKNGTPLLFRIWKVGDALGTVIKNNRWYRGVLTKLEAKLSRVYTSLLLKRGLDVGKISTERLLKDIRDNTPWAKVIDEAIVRYVKAGEFEERTWTKRAKREEALELIKKLRSLELRTSSYRELLKSYGTPEMGLREKAKAYWALYKAFKEAEAIWTKEVLEELKQAPSLLEAWKISEKAWDDHVGKRATERGVSKPEALLLLKKLYDANLRVESPYASEVAAVFPEASRHRDEFLEEWAKKRPMNYEQLKMLEDFKSRNSESPYHKIAKGMFELVDEYITKLNPMERAQVALYLSGFDAELPTELDAKITKLFYGTENRRKALTRRGFYFTLKDVKIFFKETHVEERTGVFRAMFIGSDGIAGNVAAEQMLIDKLLMADANMPKYLRKVLNIYLTKVSPTERSLLLSYLLANGDQGTLKGPEVVKLLVEKGGVAAAKLAQVIASHGFKLPAEYQEVLEKFKGDAQQIDKIIALKLIRDRLPTELFKQIKTLDRELGSGSLKVAYSATLKDGRKVVIKLARDHVYYQTAREFELLRSVMEEVMKDPDLAIDNLPGIEQEVERIIRGELNFKEEFEKEKRHKEAYEARPVLLRWLGNNVSVVFPQPLEGWQGEGILVEEFVKAMSWNEIPEKGLFGWSKEKLAKAAINEVLNQMMAYMNPSELPADGKIILDIDPHEENQLAKKAGFFSGKKMVDIDLGQSVTVTPEVMRGFGAMIYGVYRNELEGVINAARKYIVFRSDADVQRFREELYKQAKLHDDPIEVLTKTMEETELEGIMLRPEYLFYQKLFATLIGLKRHVSDKDYLTTQTKKLIILRGLSHPAIALKELSLCKAALTEQNFESPAGKN